MGCDIHEIIEKRQPDGTWKHVNVPLETWRCYDVFSLLAGVRNGKGFAGCLTGQGFVPISKLKGLPANTTYRENLRDDDMPWLGDHSFSWLTLRELKEYDYDQSTVKYGVISEDQYKAWKAKGGGFPEGGWSGSIISWSHETVTPEEMDKILSGERPREVRHPQDSCLIPTIAVKVKPTEVTYNVRVSWPIKYREVAGMILEHIIPALESIAGDDPDSVRLVFGFDS